ncbi:TIGR02680 family protein [Sporosarcina limicola]|uniref:Uncharacterized protein (TIGR02680 family) n=1 Tax=Sporosarcina limicola TaxID=34101 RepID=A0A927MNU3_9BACL|nr:TIGR02680 family protein [Sporosarcina limicola]MBE1556537.1 uncharacterized protein (TIGR02680 family) [Sporosarcina limicola]
MNDKWKMNRAGLLNFWYYDEETFDFENGKLLLRGSNGSGKSVTMQSFLPILLDGKKSPDRLDPFGSRSRRMEDYLLGEKEITNREERTGYLFIEYKKENTNQYITTGIGMQAKRNRPLKSWGFVITDNRRIGYDFDLYKKESQGGDKVKIPRSQVELENAIGNGGEVVKTNQEYMELVNKHVFGFSTTEAYEDLIKLLIQLRSPKLSKDYKPTVIYEILEEALPPLSDEDLRYLSDSIEQMDQTKQQIEQLDREVVALRKLLKSYDAYNHRILYDQVNELKKTNNQVRKEQDEQQRLVKEIQNLELEIEQLTIEIQGLEHSEESLKSTSKRLQTHRIWSLEDERAKEQKECDRYKGEQARKDDRLEGYLKKERQSMQKKSELKNAIDSQSNELAEHLEEMSYGSEQSAFGGHEQNVLDFNRYRTEQFPFDMWKQEVNAHNELLELAAMKIQEFEQLKEKIQQKQKDIGDAEFERDKYRDDEKSWLNTFTEDKQKKISEIHEWSVSNNQYEIDDAAYQKLARTIEELYEPHSYGELKSGFHSIVHSFDEALHLSKLKIENDIEVQGDKKQKKLKELAMRKIQKDPEPDRHPDTIEARKKLSEKGEIFASFYEVIEFQPHVSDEVQKRIESALIETGLLDALVTNRNVQIEHDRILKPQPNLLANTLADFIRVDSEQTVIQAERVEEILQSILIGKEEGLIQLDVDGSYRIGIVDGHAVPVDEVRYVGREARKRYRETLIQQLEMELVDIESTIRHFNGKKADLIRKLDDSTAAWLRFPLDDDLQSSYNYMLDARKGVKFHNGRIEKLSEERLRLDEDFQVMRIEIHEKTHSFTLEQTSIAYKEALKHSRVYENSLNDFHRMHQSFLHKLGSLDSAQDLLKEVQFEIDELKGELIILSGKIDIAEKSIKQMDEELALEGAEDIRKQIRKVQAELSEVESSLADKNKTLPARNERRKSLEAAMGLSIEQLMFWENMQSSWTKAVGLELKKGFIEIEEMDVLDISRIEAGLSLDASKDKSHIESKLTKDFFEVSTDLTEHRMRESGAEIPVEPWMQDVQSVEWQSIIDQWKQKTTRRIIEFDKRGVQVNPYVLFREVSQEQFIQENRLNEQDKELYEEILFNSVGNKLRSRIRRAEQWTDKMRKLMESRDSSSGLKFSIKWRPKTADSEQEMDTKDLVMMLKQDANLLKDEDLERITSHFRSKIQSAKSWIEEKGDGQTLLQVLKGVLDYRKWFSFVLYYERTNEPRRELTNHKFFTFSGGEKAMAMYIPLFTACYSRYQEADASAPYIISLDEAFAGVDENNIKEMFEIVEHLDFDYIMNSQVLWGDYETIKSLAICELIRPKNADFVTVIRYKWDGQTLIEVPDGEKQSIVTR